MSEPRKELRPEEPKSGLYLGSCAVCGVGVLNHGPIYENGPPIVLCVEHNTANLEDGVRYVYCLKCGRVTFTLRLKEEDARTFPYRVGFDTTCPICNDEFKGFNLKSWRQL